MLKGCVRFPVSRLFITVCRRWGHAKVVKKSSSHRAVTVALATLLKGDKDVLNIVTDEAIDATD